MSDDKPKTEMTKEDAERIAKSDTDPAFKETAKKVADNNEKKAEEVKVEKEEEKEKEEKK